MSQYRNILIEQGESWEMVIHVSDMNGLPLDLTDYTVTMRMKKSYHAKEFIQFNTEITDAIKGEIKIWLDETDTAKIKPLRYVYDCIVNGPSSVKIIEGIATVYASASI